MNSITRSAAPANHPDSPTSLPWAAEQTESAITPIAVVIAATTARRIVEGEHPPGTILTEKVIAEAEGASRTPVREAMLQLQRWGLVRLAPKKGAVVTAPTPKEKSELLQVRVMLEESAFREVVNGDANLTAELLQKLRIELDNQRSAADNGDPLAFAEADHRFHSHIIHAMGNRVVDDIFLNLAPQLARLTHEVMSNQPEKHFSVIEEHESLLVQLSNGSPESFAKQLRHHITASHDTQLTRAEKSRTSPRQ